MESNTPRPSGSKSLLSGPWILGLALLLLIALRVLLGSLSVSPGLSEALGWVVGPIFIFVPVLALYFGADYHWNWRWALGFVIAGVAIQFGFQSLFLSIKGQVLPSLAFQSLAQTGLLIWCVGLGALIATLIRDRNLVAPIAIFLAGVDVFLVTAPVAPTRAIVENNPKVFQNLAYTVPSGPASAPDKVGVAVQAYVGPADFFFLFMFFVCVFKFGLRTRASFLWTVGTLVVYFLVNRIFGDQTIGPVSLGMLPVMLPVGLVMLFVNLPELKMKNDEKLMTAFVALIALGLASTGFILAAKKQASQPGILQTDTGPKAPPPQR